MEKNFTLIAGPCVLESQELAEVVAQELVKIQEEHPEIRVIFKSSFDKANRSSIKSFRGIGFEEAKKIFTHIREHYHLPILTDFHEPCQAEKVAEFCDVLQIPAFLCRQTNMLRAAAETGKSVSVKKGQFLSPWDMKHVVEKLKIFGAKEIFQIERGTSFGYGSLVVDMRSFQVMRENHTPVIYDLTHSLQLPGMGNECTAGAREFADTMARAAIGAGIDGLFIETHPEPAKALCDASTQLPLATLRDRIRRYLQLQKTVNEIRNDEI